MRSRKGGEEGRGSSRDSRDSAVHPNGSGFSPLLIGPLDFERHGCRGLQRHCLYKGMEKTVRFSWLPCALFVAFIRRRSTREDGFAMVWHSSHADPCVSRRFSTGRNCHVFRFRMVYEYSPNVDIALFAASSYRSISQIRVGKKGMSFQHKL